MYAVMAAVFGGLVITFLSLLFGDAVVRILKLPRDLPDGPRFEPPPPAAHAGDRAASQAIAEKQRRLQRIYAEAHNVFRMAQQAHDLWSSADAMARAANGDKRLEYAKVATVLEGVSKQAGDEATAAEQAMRGGSPDQAERAVKEHAVKAAALLAQANQAISVFPGANDRRRLYILLALVAVGLVWLLVLLASLAKRGM